MSKVLLNRLTDREGNFKLAILRHPLYLWGLLFKGALSAFFAGRLLVSYFIPFVEYFWTSGFSDPYAYFLDIGQSEAFPYPALMLYLLSLLGGTLGYLSPFFIRIPLLLMDTAILIVLSRMIGRNERKLLVYYWWSPVLIYISYIHGQLDVIPIAFLIASTYFLVKKKYNLASVILGMGIVSKTNLILAIPLFFLFIWKNEPFDRKKKLLSTGFLMGSVSLLLSLPFLFSESYLKMVYDNMEQVKVWSARFSMINSLEFYLIPAVYIILLVAASRLKKFSKDLFVMMVGFSFAVLLLFIPPQPGWYFWVLPFLIYFNIKERKVTFLPVLALQIAFLLFFAVSPVSDYTFVLFSTERSWSIYQFISDWGINADRVVNLSFTLLQTFLILNIFWIYNGGIRRNLDKRLITKPFMIGVGGDSGVGKSTLTSMLSNLFGKDQVSVIRGDDMHRWERGHAKWNELTHLSPKANHLHLDIKHLKLLRTGKPINRRVYDHSTGKFTTPKRLFPGKLVIFEGLHPFYIEAKRNLFNLKVFIDPDNDLRLYWKLKRDMANRGYSKDEVIKQLQMRAEDSEKYIQSQASYSDIRIGFFPVSEVPDIAESGNPELGLKIYLDTSIDIYALVQVVSMHSELQLTHEYEEDHQTLEVFGNLDKGQIEGLIYQLPINTHEVLDEAKFEGGLNGFLQILLLYVILMKIENE